MLFFSVNLKSIRPVSQPVDRRTKDLIDLQERPGGGGGGGGKASRGEASRCQMGGLTLILFQLPALL